MNRILIVAAAAVGLLVLPAQAADVTAGSLKISQPWARATPKGASVGGGYLSITNGGSEADRLVGGSSAICQRLEIHQMKMDGGVMKMRPVAGGVSVAPGQTVKFDPSGYHIMFIGLKQQLMQGGHFKATLEFAKAGKVDVDFTVEGVGAMHGGDNAMPSMGGKPMPGMGGMK